MIPLVILFATVACVVVAWATVQHSPRDAVTMLSLWALLGFLVSARLVIPGAGAVGTPANVVAIFCLLWWLAGVLAPTLGLDRTVNPVRYAVYFYVCVMLLAYGLASQRPLSDLELSGSDRRLIGVLVLAGLALLATDGLRSMDRVEVLLKRFVRLAVVVSILGIAQFGWQLDVVSWIKPPLLVENIAIIQGQMREAFLRPASTALHPIEYSVVLTGVLPFALVFALRSTGHRAWGWWLCVLTLVTGAFISVSRSAVLAIVVVALVMAAGWNWRRRVNVGVLGVGFVIALGAVVPGLLGTFRALIFRADEDPSIEGRLIDLREVSQFLTERPFTGRGLGTFSIEEYFVLDNEYLRTSVETGVVGLLALCVFVAVGLVTAWQVSRSADSRRAELGSALLATIAVCSTCMFTFDLLAYPMVSGLWFICTGIVGFLWREEHLERRAKADEGAAGKVVVPSPV